MAGWCEITLPRRNDDLAKAYQMGRGDNDGIADLGMVSGVQQTGVSGVSGGGNGINAVRSVGVEKKLRKRRELDAMVANLHKARKRVANGGNGVIVRNGKTTPSSQELLADHHSEFLERGGGGDEDDELEVVLHGGTVIEEEDEEETESSELGFGLGGRGGKMGKMKGRKLANGPSSPMVSAMSILCRTCSGLWLVSVVVGMCFMVVFAVLGLHVQMKLQLDTFRNQLEQGAGGFVEYLISLILNLISSFLKMFFFFSFLLQWWKNVIT